MLPQDADLEAARLLAHAALQDVESIQLARGLRAFHVTTDRLGQHGYWRFGADRPETDIPQRLRVEPLVLELHEHLLLGKTGDVIVRTLGPIAAALMIVGLMLWWPLRTGWRARDVLPRSASRSHLLRSHLALGALGGLLLVTHAATGALMATIRRS
ncbi:MAG: hypothetical protein HC872_00465, partial [Gammaproteobacteria bacterium]|nr:hypothetical protein [Gammaproteobacteria bacterium]